MRKFRALLMATALAGVSPAIGLAPATTFAAVATQQIALVNSAWTDLGAGPMKLSAVGGPIVYVIADTAPGSLTAPGYALSSSMGPVDVNSASHVWALAQPGYGSTALVAPIASAAAPSLSGALPDTASGDLHATATDLGAPGATACATDTGACSLNALLQRLAQDVTAVKTAVAAIGTPTLSSSAGSPIYVAPGTGVVMPASAASGAFVAGSFVDGAIATLGTEADAAWSGSGSATEIAALKAAVAKLTTIAAGLLPAGQATSSASAPVVIASDQPPIKTNPNAATTGGAAAWSEVVPNNTTGVSVKGSAGMLYSVELGGIGSTPAYLKLYDTASAPTCGSGAPVKRLIIPAAATAADGAGSNVTIPLGLAFANGIGLCVTAGIADADATAPAASTFLVNLDYK